MEFEGIMFKMKNTKILEHYKWGGRRSTRSMVLPELAQALPDVPVLHKRVKCCTVPATDPP